MGLFSSKTRTLVGTSVSRVIADDVLPNSIKSGVIKSIMKNGELSEYVLEEFVNSVAVKAERMYEYAETHYTHGLPKGDIYSATKGRAEVSAILEALEGDPVLIEYSNFGPPNSMHIAWMTLLASHGYSPVTNILGGLTAAEGTTVWLDDMTVVVPAENLDSYEPGSLGQWGTPARWGVTPERRTASQFRADTPVLADPLASTEHVRVDYIWTTVGGTLMEPLTAIHRDSFTIGLTGYDSDADYFHVKYVTAGGVTKYWMYKSGLGAQPTLDALFDVPVVTNGTYFPFAYFRYDGVPEIEDKASDSYKTTKKLVKYLGMDFDTVADSLEENPDIDDVLQAMVMMAVPANTTNELERRYLFSFFDNLYYAKDAQYRSPAEGLIAEALSKETGINRSSVIIQDKRFKMALSDAGIYKRRVAGSIGAVGSHDSGTYTRVETTDYIDQLDIPRSDAKTITSHYYRRQITVGMYEEIVVESLQMLYYILNGFNSLADDTDEILLIPIDRSITEHYFARDREELYARSLHYLFNSVQYTKVAWYQTEFFKFVLLVVAVVITVLSLGSGVNSLMAALATGSSTAISAALVTLMVEVLTSLLIAQGLKMFVKAVGLEAALIIAVLAAAFGYFQALDAGSIAGAPWAQELLELSSGLAKAAGEVTKDLMKGLMEDYQSLSLLMSDAEKQLEAANDLLKTNNILSPFVIFGESPNDFYNRTVHSGNIGLLGISAISNYVDIALTLPKLNETIGESPYA